MGILKRKKAQTQSVGAEIEYPNEFRRQLCIQGQLAEEMINKHIKGNRIQLDSLRIRTEKIEQIYIVGNSDYYPLALLFSHNFEAICDIHTSAYLLSEFCCDRLVMGRKTLVILLAETGEEGEVAKRVKDAKAAYVFINDLIEEKAALSIPVAEYTLRYIMLTLIALYIGRKNQSLTELYYKLAVTALKNLRKSINDIMKNESYILSVADGMPAKGLVITGRNVDFATAVYVSNLFTSALGSDVRALPSGELGRIIGRDNIIALASNDSFWGLLPDERYTLKIAPLSCTDSADSICYQSLLPLLNPLLCAIIGQIIAYSIIYNT